MSMPREEAFARRRNMRNPLGIGALVAIGVASLYILK